MVSVCPDEALLRRLGTDDIGESTFLQISEHLDHCGLCQRFLQKLVSEDRQQTPAPALGIPVVPGFEVIDELGRGGNGIVVLARECNLDRFVALKCLPRWGRAPSGASFRMDEAQAVSRLRDPHVVRLYQVLETTDWTVLVLEFIPGGTLGDRLSEPLLAKDAAALAEVVARTVARVHRAGLLHLDIKPSNILLDDDSRRAIEPGAVRLSDFGVACQIRPVSEESDYPTGPRGTPSYMAPEQTGRRNLPLNASTDVYAIGALLYHMLTGRPPFQSPSARETIELICTVEAVPPRSLNPRISRDLELICLQCLAKQSEQRYASADQLADDLRRYLQGEPIAARPASRVELALRWCRRYPAISLLALSLGGTIIASLISLWSLWRSAEANRALAVEARESAEQNEQSSSRSLVKLETWMQYVLEDPTLLQEKPLPALTDDVRQLTASLHGDGDSTARMAATIGILHRDLARKLAERPGKLSHADQLLSDTCQFLREELQKEPSDERLATEYVMLLLDSGNLAFRVNDRPRVVANLREASMRASRLSDRESRLKAIVYASIKRRLVAHGLRLDGRRSDAAALLVENLESVNSALLQDPQNPDVRLQAAITQIEIGQVEQALALLPALAETAPSAWLLIPALEERGGNWVSKQFVHALIDGAAQARTADEPPCLISIDTLVADSESFIKASGQPALSTPTVVLIVAEHVSDACAAHRRNDHLELAQQLERSFLEITQRTAANYPTDPAAFNALSESLIQVAKNAFRRDAMREAVEALEQSLSAAQTAVQLDPLNVESQRRVEDRQQRLKRAATM